MLGFLSGSDTVDQVYTSRTTPKAKPLRRSRKERSNSFELVVEGNH